MKLMKFFIVFLVVGLPFVCWALWFFSELDRLHEFIKREREDL